MKILITEETGLPGEIIRSQFASDPNLSSAAVLFTPEAGVLELVRSGEFDVLVTEVELEKLSSVELVNRLSRIDNRLQVVFYTNSTSFDDVTSLLKSGAQGYISKDEGIEGLIRGVHSVTSGGAPLSPRISKILLSEYRRESLAYSLHVLTRREKQVFQCIEEGNSYKGISSKLHISQNTVHTHVKNIYSKLHAINKYDALLKAKEISAVSTPYN